MSEWRLGGEQEPGKSRVRGEAGVGRPRKAFRGALHLGNFRQRVLIVQGRSLHILLFQKSFRDNIQRLYHTVSTSYRPITGFPFTRHDLAQTDVNSIDLKWRRTEQSFQKLESLPIPATAPLSASPMAILYRNDLLAPYLALPQGEKVQAECRHRRRACSSASELFVL